MIKNIFASLALLSGVFLSPASYGTVETGLIGYYSFESDLTNQSATTTLPDAVAVQTPIPGTANGRAGNAMALQGTENDHLSLTASYGNGTTLGESFTLSAWYKLNTPIVAPSLTGRYFVFEGTSDFDLSYGIRDLGSGVAGPNDGQVYTDGSNFTVPDAAVAGWHHVLQTVTPTNSTILISTYIDGLHVGDLSTAPGSFAGTGLNVGAARSSETNRGFDGLIDELAVWNRPLTRSERATVYALGLNGHPLTTTPPAANPPSINAFNASPATIGSTDSTTLSWNVSGAETVTIDQGIGNVAATDSQAVFPGKSATYILVAINSNTTVTAEAAVTVRGATDPVGPYVGTLATTEAHLLYSPGPHEWDLRLSVFDPSNTITKTVDATTIATNDYVAQFHVTGLTPGTTYTYRIDELPPEGGTYPLVPSNPHAHFSTVPTNRINRVVTAAFLSCVNDSTDDVWTQIAQQNIDLLCLGGDTPYVDTGDLTSIRQKHRHLLKRPNLAAIGINTSVVGTWDDHDFGLNGGNGVSTASRKTNTRRGHVEYRAHAQYGTGSEGIYHKTDMGAMEVFLLDPRWFSQTAASPTNATQSTCFGADQWQWLLDGLHQSDAPFKVLLQGQIWQDKKNGETDDMHTYWAERDALFDWIKAEGIPGVVLVGGDIHVSRYLKHHQRLGYDLHDFVSSPGHTGVISSLNVYHPDLEWSRAAANQFLTLRADTTQSIPTLTARYLDQDGTLHHEVVIPYDQLSPKETSGLGRDLRAHWTFDGDGSNRSPLGDRIDATLVSGATATASGGIRGGALDLSRAQSQHANVPRSVLDDNANAFTASLWCKPTTLPAHGSGDRHFLIESKVNNHVGLPQASTTGYAISVGLRATTDAQKINLQLYTETLDPKTVGSQQSPGTLPQGPFDFDVDRSVFDAWTQVAVTFNTTHLSLYVNGALAHSHALPTAAPLAENGGLVIGGHRTGTGRNFDGLIDEVALWNRVLSPTEITDLYNNGSPPDLPPVTTHRDSDSDGLPDFWENLHGLNPATAADAGSDSDADGLVALQEFGMGTLPQSPTSPRPYQQLMLSVTGKEYQAITYQRDPSAIPFLATHVQRSPSLGADRSWSTLDTLIHEVVPAPPRLEQVTERSSVPVADQTREYLRIRFAPADL